MHNFLTTARALAADASGKPLDRALLDAAMGVIVMLLLLTVAGLWSAVL